MRIALMFGVLFLLAGCVYLDNTMLDSAEPLRPGKPEIQLYTGTGFDVSSVVIKEESVPCYPDGKRASEGQVWGCKTAIGLGNDFELGYKSWTGEGVGSRLILKKRFYYDGDYSIAVSPSGYFLKKKSGYDREVYGWEAPVLITYRPIEQMGFTMKLHYSNALYSESYRDDQYMQNVTRGPYKIEHFGVVGGFNLKANIFSLYAEIGLDLINGHNNPTQIFIQRGFGIGLEF